jgi:hypothetical protein
MQWFPLSFCMIVFRHTVGLLWTSDQPVSETSLPAQDNTTYKHNRQTSMPSAEFEPETPATADLRLRPRGYRGRQCNRYTARKTYIGIPKYLNIIYICRANVYKQKKFHIRLIYMFIIKIISQKSRLLCKLHYTVTEYRPFSVIFFCICSSPYSCIYLYIYSLWVRILSLIVFNSSSSARGCYFSQIARSTIYYNY